MSLQQWFLGLFESTRYARGHKALYTLEINGEHASLFWDLHDLHRLRYFDHSDDRSYEDGEVSTFPMVTNPIWVTGGSQAYKLATNTLLLTKLLIS